MMIFLTEQSLQPSTKPKSQRRKVALLVETSNEYARGILRGIQNYLREQRPWYVDLREQSRDRLEWDWLRRWSGDGIIARIQTSELADYLRSLQIPVINLSSAHHVGDFPCVETDDSAFAQTAADHLQEHGFRHFAFCGHSGYSWSRFRYDKYNAYLAEQGFSCAAFDAASANGDASLLSNRLIGWLQTLPAPVGIMASYDTLGQQILDACRQAELTVPHDVGVIGVDNDELICELSTPSLSSIVPNTLRIGYLAASLLEAAMNGNPVNNEIHLVPPFKLITRASTDRLAIDDRLVSDTIQYIREHAHDALTVQSIVSGIPISRRVLESRFMKAVGYTPHTEIVRVKVNLIKQLLNETSLSLEDIAERTGFAHNEYMSVLFKRETGYSPGEYRKKNRIGR